MQVLPVREQLKFGLNFAVRRAVPKVNNVADSLGIKHIPFTASGRLVKPPVYVPDFKAGIQVSLHVICTSLLVQGKLQNSTLDLQHVCMPLTNCMYPPFMCSPCSTFASTRAAVR